MYFLIIYAAKKAYAELGEEPDADFEPTEEEQQVEFSADSLQGIYEEAGERLKTPDIDVLERTVLA